MFDQVVMLEAANVILALFFRSFLIINDGA